MDMGSALDTMQMLCSRDPSQAYKSSYYRKQTKDHWSRDDPAFLVLQTLLHVISTICYTVAFNLPFLSSLRLFVTFLLIHLLLGFLLSSFLRHLANTHLVARRNHSVQQQVEHLYAFDIHANSYFVLFIYLHLAQFFLLPLLLSNTFPALLASNLLYLAAFSHYFYITHLGYRALPFLRNTEYFLYPIAAMGALTALSLIGHPLGISANAARICMYLLVE
ncbi:hypothetical protein TrCOL_g7499 [Triparma columacea]|uniref:UNC-50-like protein n=1 Tax=Triparma columacea TaxID=722753 RepID=A0A9W7G1X8_9STRA|nr:hypothetical protein TrCOL_g7499 [Triparma columacea]